MKKDNKIEPLLFDTYISAIKNSIGSKTYRQIFAKVNGKKKDITENGNLSCAYYVTSLLLIFKLVNEVHATVSGTVRDIEKSGWTQIDKPKVGAIIVWGKKDFGKGDFHSHIGFYIGKNEAISNSPKKGIVEKHHFTYKNTRKIEKIFWHKRLTP